MRTSLPPVEGIFFNGQIFDAYKFATDLIRSARQSIVLIDNYIDESVLLMLSKRDGDVSATVYTGFISPQLRLDIDRFNSQYPPVEVRTCTKSHDRFLIIDSSEVYHIGASLKDLGKKLFAFSKLDIRHLLFLNGSRLPFPMLQHQKSQCLIVIIHSSGTERRKYACRL